MKVTVVQAYEVKIPKEFEDKPLNELINDLNSMYDIHGKNVIEAMNGEDEYLYTKILEIDEEEVFIDNNNDVNYATGSEIILDGQPLKNN